MNKACYILALDQGTTSSRAILYNSLGQTLKLATRSLAVNFPKDGWVEQNAEEIWQTQLETIQEVALGVDPTQIKSIGITNQRETIVAWHKKTGKPMAPAIVWQCRRSAEICQGLKKQGLAEFIQKKTGLVIDSYFSASKITWLIENIPGLQELVVAGEIIFGTVDSWLLYKLTVDQQAVFATEASNASRTMLFSIETGDWDEELLKVFRITRANLAQVKASNDYFGSTKVLGPEIPITGILGDQQASLLGHGCCQKNSVKCTFGTGAFLLVNTGQEILQSSTGLLSTVAWNNQGALTYALEGSIFIAGALIQWLRDSLGLIASSADSEIVAAEVEDSNGVIVVPAFVGLGAPYWDAQARGIIAGLTRDAKRAHIVRACLEAVAHQVADIFEDQMLAQVKDLSIDGGMSNNKLFCQILANLTGKEIRVGANSELTALGAAKIAAQGINLDSEFAEITKELSCVGEKESLLNIFKPKIEALVLKQERKRWKRGVERSRGWIE